MLPPVDRSTRLRYLDWTRGVAAIIMLQGHTFHSFTRNDLRNGAPYVLSQFLGGIAPAIFLLLTGVTLAFRMDGDEKRGWPAGKRVLSAMRRARYLIVVAFLFRLQLWAFSWPNGTWSMLLKVDVLNCMALAVAVFSIMAVFRTSERARLCAILGTIIAVVSPLISQLDWSKTPPLLKAYLAPHTLFFGFFPWAAFLAFGMSLGSALRLLGEEQIDRGMQWACLVGAALIAGGRYFAEIPYSLYSKSEFWLDSPTLIFIKLGVMLWMLALAFLWTRYAAPSGWSWVCQLGTTSLLVYWIHIELVYGRWLGYWKEGLDNGATAALAAGMILLMLAISVAKTYGSRWGARRAGLSWYPFTSPRPSGD